MLTPAMAAQALAGSVGINRNVAQVDATAGTGGVFGLGIAAVQVFVILQFGEEVVEMGLRLALRVGDDPDVFFAAVEGFLEHVEERDERGFRAAARGEEVQFERSVWVPGGG